MRAVHRLQAEAVPVVVHRREHVFAEDLQMPRDAVQLLARDVRAVDQVVAVFEQRGLEEFLDRVPQEAPVRVPQDEAGPHLLLYAVEVEFPAQPAVVAAARLLKPLQVLVQRLPAEEGGAVDALQHLPLLVSPPVRARRGEQLEVLHPPRGGNVRAAAQVEEGAVLVDGDHLVVAHLLQPLQLERVVGEEVPALLLRNAAALEGMVARDHLPHAGLERLQILGREGLVDLEVVVEAVVDGRPEADAGPRPQLAHRGGEDVRGRVAQHGKRLVVPAGEDAHLGVRGDGSSQVHDFAVHGGRQRGLGQPGADARGNVTCAASARRLDGPAIGEPHLDEIVSHQSLGELRGSGPRHERSRNIHGGTRIVRVAPADRHRGGGERREPGRLSPPGLRGVSAGSIAGRTS